MVRQALFHSCNKFTESVATICVHTLPTTAPLSICNGSSTDGNVHLPMLTWFVCLQLGERKSLKQVYKRGRAEGVRGHNNKHKCGHLHEQKLEN